MNRSVRIVGPALLLLVALISLVVALGYGGGAAAPAILDPGPFVRYGLPIAKLAVNIGAAGTIGALVVACFALSPTAKDPSAPKGVSREFGAALDVAAGSAAFYAVAAGATAFFSFLNITQTPLTFDRDFGTKLSFFITSIESGQAWLITTLVAAVVTVLCFAVRNQTVLVFVTALAFYSLLPMAQQGHAAGASGHDAAVTALGLHILFAAIWLGGLLTIILIRGTLDGGRIVPVISRYSSIALVSFVVVAASGYVSAELRVGSLDRLLTPYGVLVLAKVAALIALGFFGVVQRNFLIGRMRGAATDAQRATVAARAVGGRGATAPATERASVPDAVRRTSSAVGGRFFWLLVTSELAFMGLASGVAAALARTAPPVTETTATELSDPTPAQVLTGEVLPPPPTVERFFTLWNFDLLWVLACAFGIAFYLLGVWRLHRRGDRWPIHRTVLWVAGMLLLFYITNGGVNVYEKYLFSPHMLAHMVLTMAVPVLLVPGAPVTLAARAIEKRTDGSRGGREWILLAVHSKFAGVIANPIVAAVLFVGSLWVFYYSPLFRWSMEDHIGHEWMIIHFLITGYLFVQSLIGVDPVPYRMPYPFRLTLLLATMAFHAFFGLALMTGTGLLLADWYGAMGWGTDALADQQAGGGIAWSVGEIPTVILAITVAIMWSRNDAKETKRRDRHADRTNEAELNDYNERLAALGRRDG